MKTAIFAALLAFGAASATIVAPPAQAASITITTDDGWRHDNGRHLGWYKDRPRGWYKQRRFSRRDCDIEVRRYWSRGRLFVERTRDCD